MALCISFTSWGSVQFPQASPESCPGFVVLDATEYKALKSFPDLWAFDVTLMGTVFAGALACWAAGLGVGLVITLIRKLRTP
jgi:hypothetical protein